MTPFVPMGHRLLHIVEIVLQTHLDVIAGKGVEGLCQHLVCGAEGV